MRTLVYKRTHTGDPDALGRFGVNDCMGSARSWDYDVVIGIGGKSAEPRKYEIADKVTWIGIGPTRHHGERRRGPIVTFDHFVLLDSIGPLLAAKAPKLASKMYAGRTRHMLIPDDESKWSAEAAALKDWATRQPDSRGGRRPKDGVLAELSKRCPPQQAGRTCGC